MALFLNILKMIGIILLCILALLLVLLLLALFCPAVYRIRGEKQDKLLLHARISWLFPLIYGKIKYEGQLSCILYLLGIPVYDVLGEKPLKSKKTEKNKKEKKKQKGKKKENKAAKKGKGSKREENRDEKRKEDIENTENTEKKVIRTQEEQEKSTLSARKQEAYAGSGKQKTVMEGKTQEPQESGVLENPEMAEKHDEEEKPSMLQKLIHPIKEFFQKVKLFFQKVFEKVRNIKYTILNMKEKLENLKETIYWYKEVLEREESRRAITKGKQNALKFLKHVSPKKVKGNILFGFGDPGTTGEVLGFISMFYPLFGNHITVIPDFERTIFQGDFYVKGRIRAFNLLKFGWSIFFDKDIKNLYNILTGGKNHE